ncbi:hypothetical protein MKEN_00699900 [Mycena kentingensis (nom. inval.)]|nr:hypothetical protein MKEN_00699900 [Mycena kentingensis (nom. inval.)]
MLPPIQVYFTAEFPANTGALIEQLLSRGVSKHEFILDPALHGLSPTQLFKHQNCSFSHYPFALVADTRTLLELEAQNVPTLALVITRSHTAFDEWDLYDGPDLRLLTPLVRLALLRAMAQERFTLDNATHQRPNLSSAEWFWDPPERPFRFDHKMWQVKSLRVDLIGAIQACMELAAKDADCEALYLSFESQAARTGQAFAGTAGRENQ